MTASILCSRCGNPLDLSRQTHQDANGSRRHYNRGECSYATQVAAEHQQAAEQVIAETTENVVAADRAVLATRKQIDYAFLLQSRYWTPAVYATRYEYADLATLDRIAISRVIDALVIERTSQGD